MRDRRLLVGGVALFVLGIAEMALLSAGLLVPRVVDTVAGGAGAAAAARGAPAAVPSAVPACEGDHPRVGFLAIAGAPHG